MKQFTVKTLGVAAVGAAFAAVSAGTAQAAVPDPTAALGTVTRNLPAAQKALATTLTPTTQSLQRSTSAVGPQQDGRLLGGLPAHGMNNTRLPNGTLSTLPTGVLPVG